jgi:hypothetical protein
VSLGQSRRSPAEKSPHLLLGAGGLQACGPKVRFRQVGPLDRAAERGGDGAEQRPGVEYVKKAQRVCTILRWARLWDGGLRWETSGRHGKPQSRCWRGSLRRQPRLEISRRGKAFGPALFSFSIRCLPFVHSIHREIGHVLLSSALSSATRPQTLCA